VLLLAVSTVSDFLTRMGRKMRLRRGGEPTSSSPLGGSSTACFDCVESLHHFGEKNAVAVAGTALVSPVLGSAVGSRAGT